MQEKLEDIKPYSPIRVLDRKKFDKCDLKFPIDLVSDVVGMSSTFICKVIGKQKYISASQLLALLDQDAFGETFVPRSQILEFLTIEVSKPQSQPSINVSEKIVLLEGSADKLIDKLPTESVNCVVTSPPYWGMRLYDYAHPVTWADGEICAYGHEQTPEGYIRHTIEILVKLKRVLTKDGSIWWNIMDTFNTRTQIRSNAAEALRAMQGKETKSWKDHDCRRYSAGHAFLKDGEQCAIPSRLTERASRIGLYVKSVITWTKTGSMPEPQNSRVSRNLEYILHLSKDRTPYFQKDAYRTAPPHLGGRSSNEADKLIDVWSLSTSSGKSGHGAQFALALPGRSIALSTKKGDLVLDPFSGGGTSGSAALQHNCRFIGFDVSAKYLAIAKKEIATQSTTNPEQTSLELLQELTP